MIFTSQSIELESFKNIPRYFSTTLTNQDGISKHLHCLITYEKINPELIEKSKSRPSKTGLFNFIPRESRKIPSSDRKDYYVPIALCLMTKSSYIDLFRNILELLYLYVSQICINENKEISMLISSTEFIKTCCFLLNDTIIPPKDIQININIGNDPIPIPVDYYANLSHNESCVAILIDLLDIRNIIEF